MKLSFSFGSAAVWPPVLMSVVFTFCYGVLALCLLLDAWLDVRMLLPVVLGAAAIVHVLYRLWRFHPAWNGGYATWLKSSPWTWRQPLPLGPVGLVWQDAVFIGILASLAKWHAHADPLIPVMAFVFAFLAGMTALLAVTRTWDAVVALGFLWPAPLLPVAEGWPQSILLSGMVIVIWRGHRKSLRTFPWRSWMDTEMAKAAGGKPGGEIRFAGALPTYLGWPYWILSPKTNRRSLSRSACYCLSGLAGWWSYCVIKASGMEPLPGLILIFGCVAAFVRVAYYCSGISWPFNFFGRVASRRFIIRDFDKVFLTPIGVVAVAIMGGMAINHSGTWYAMAESWVIGLICFGVLAGGPTLQNWTLTGKVRLRPVRSSRSAFPVKRV